MTDTDIEDDLKKLSDLNLKALEDDFAALLSKHVGGDFTAHLMKFEHIEAGNPLTKKVLINFVVTDESGFDRYTKFESLFRDKSDVG